MGCKYRTLLIVCFVFFTITPAFASEVDSKKAYNVPMFVDYVTQQLKTSTYKNFEDQQEEVINFFASELKSKWKKQLPSMLSRIKEDERSSLFVAKKDTLKISGLKNTLKGETVFDASITGDLGYFIGTSHVETVTITIKLTIHKQGISKLNPFGLVVVKYNEKAKY
jgi:hypothetical protein